MATQTMTAAGQPAGVKQANPNWLAIGALVVLAAIVGGLVGWAVAGGTAGTGDASFVDASIAAWTQNDQTALDTQYTRDAVFQDIDKGPTYEGIDRIKGYVAYLRTLGFVVERTGATTRAGDDLITPVRYGRPGDWSYAITVFRLRDGRIAHHTGFSLPDPGQ